MNAVCCAESALSSFVSSRQDASSLYTSIVLSHSRAIAGFLYHHLLRENEGTATTGAKVRYRCRRCSSRLQMLVGRERFTVSCPLALIGGAFYRFFCSSARSFAPHFLLLFNP